MLNIIYMKNGECWPRLWVRTHFFDSVAIVHARARSAQRLPPRSGAFRKFWAHRDAHGEKSVSGMALGLSTGKTFFVRNLELCREVASFYSFYELISSD